MTDKEKVLKVWPDATAFRVNSGSEFLEELWWIWSEPGEKMLGRGNSEEAAWQNAAESLPAQPEQWIELTSDALRFGNKPPVIRCFDCKSEGGFHKANCRDTSRYEVPVEAKEKCPEICRKCNHPHYNMEDSEFCRSMNDEEETNCPKREEGIHCNCWYDGNPCCACGDVKTEPIAEPKPTPFTPTERVNNPYKLPWEAMAGSIIDTVHMTPEDYVNEKLVEQLKRYFVPQTDSSSISTEQTWLDFPTASGYWWHHDGNPDIRPFIYHIQISFTGRPRYFIDFPDSRWCDEVGGKWIKVVEPIGWNAAKGQSDGR